MALYEFKHLASIARCEGKEVLFAHSMCLLGRTIVLAASQVEDQEVTLKGKEKVKLRLKFRGLRDARFDIVGISWRLEGLVPGHRALYMRQLPQPRSRYASAFCSEKTCIQESPARLQRISSRCKLCRLLKAGAEDGLSFVLPGQCSIRLRSNLLYCCQRNRSNTSFLP